jgi:dipeptidyl-peptidase 4
MARFSGYWWSPDSKTIAYEEVDHEGVEQWFVADATKPEQTPLPQYYPRPGKKNVSVRLGLIPIGGGTTTWIDWDRKKYEYLASVKWDKAGPLTILLQDRKQQSQSLCLVDPKSATLSELVYEGSGTEGFLELFQDLPRWTQDGKRFLWIAHVDNGLWVELRQLTPKSSEVVGYLSEITPQSILSFDVRNGSALISGWDKKNLDTTRNILARVEWPEGKLFKVERLFDSTPGQYSASGSLEKSVFVVNNTSTTQMPTSKVYCDFDKLIGELPSVADNPSFSPNVQFLKLDGEQGYSTAILRPQNFDPKKKYPVIVDVYGGPHHLHVLNSMRNWLLPQWLADQGFIVVAIDNRGTPGRDHQWVRSIYQKFGSVPLEGQVEGLQALGKKYPEMDLEKIGIVGWSFGGYMSALAVLKRPDVFKAAVAGAPVTDWEDYDTHYTERYMGLLPESKKAYEESSLLPLASKLERPLLLVHGTADDNVYFRHTLRLTDALFRAGKDFEVLPLPSLTHMVPDPIVTERLWTRIAKHFQKHLK